MRRLHYLPLGSFERFGDRRHAAVWRRAMGRMCVRR